MENKCCRYCMYSVLDEPSYFCFYYKKYVWNNDEAPIWCSKFVRVKGE